MVEYLDKIGLTYLWGKLKTLLNGKVDKVSSTDNAIARFDGTSGFVQNSDASINDSGHVTANKFVTSGGNSSQVVSGDGTLRSVENLPVRESYLTWGGKNFSDAYGPIDAAMVSELGACRTMFAKAQGIVIEYSRDSGETWIDYDATDAEKTALFSTGHTFSTGKNPSDSEPSTQYMLRVTLRTSAASVYTRLNKFVMYVGTGGSSACYCTIRCRLQKDYVDGTDNWEVFANKVNIGGWSGYNVINVSSFITYGNNQSTQYGEVQFIFGYTGISNPNYSGLYVSKIFGFGGTGWTTPSNMAKTGHLYSFNHSQDATFPGKVTATSIVKSGGTASQFLKADGSVDSKAYITSSDLPSIITGEEMDSIIEEETVEETVEETIEETT